MNVQKKLSFKATLTGKVNGENIKLKGSGTIENGTTDGKYNLISMPHGFSPSMLSVVLITGYPNACAPLHDTPNIFVGSSYHYNRDIVFNTGHSLHLKTTCQLIDNHLDSTFELYGNAESVELPNIEPLIESWEPCGIGKIKGRFTASWYNEKTTSYITAEVKSEYFIETKDEQRGLIHRFVQIENEVDGTSLRKLQNVLLFRKLENQK